MDNNVNNEIRTNFDRNNQPVDNSQAMINSDNNFIEIKLCYKCYFFNTFSLPLLLKVLQ